MKGLGWHAPHSVRLEGVDPPDPPTGAAVPAEYLKIVVIPEAA